MARSGSFKTSGYNGRYLLFSWEITSQSIANNTSTISWTLTGAGTASANWYKAGNFKVTIDGKIVYSSTTRINLYDGTKVASGTYTFTHNSAGEKSFTAYAEAGIYLVAVNCTGSGTFALDAIPRASTINSVSGNKITDKFAVKYTRYATQFSDTLQVSVAGRKPSQTISDYTSGATFELSEALKSDIYAASQTSQSATLAFQLVTYNGSTIIGTSAALEKSVTVNDSQPSIGNVTYSDINTATTAITGDASKVIRGYSVVSVTATDISAFNGATLTKLNITLGGISKDVTISGSTVSTQTVAIGTVDLSTDTVLYVTATDSRGNTATASANVTVLDYEPPQANISCKRKDNFYSETILTVNPLISYIDGKNAATISAYSKEQDAASYGNAVSVTAGTPTTLNLDNKTAWNVKVVVADRLNSTTYVLFVEKGQPIIFFDRVKSSVGVNCFPTDNNSLEVSGKNVYNSLVPSGGTSGQVLTKASGKDYDVAWKEPGGITRDVCFKNWSNPMNASPSAYVPDYDLTSYWWLDVWGVTNDGDSVYTKVAGPVVGSKFVLSCIAGNGGDAWGKYRQCVISDAHTIKTQQNANNAWRRGEVYFADPGWMQGNDVITITEIWGWRL